jgi:hypothetical protein
MEPEPQPETVDELRQQLAQHAHQAADEAKKLRARRLTSEEAVGATVEERAEARKEALRIFLMSGSARVAAAQSAAPLVAAELGVLVAEQRVLAHDQRDQAGSDGDGPVDATVVGVAGLLKKIFEDPDFVLAQDPDFVLEQEPHLAAQLKHVVRAAAEDLAYPPEGELHALLRTVTGDGGVPVSGGLLAEAFAFRAGDVEPPKSKFADFAGKEPMMFDAAVYPTLAKMNHGDWISVYDEDDRDDDEYGFFWEATSKPRKPCVCSTPALPH